ncbi:MAG: hypothetical protein JWO08_152, partial [Verrucomicrobiaceae bacterium]|nr:hypothetical protein [Verrucomicrobiaceae bacterium]
MTAAPLAFLGVFTFFSIRASAEPLKQAQTRHLLEVFNVPSATAYDLLSQGLDGPQLHARIMEALTNGTATLGKLMAITASAGVQPSLEQTEDYLYPTELDPPQLPQTLAIINPEPKISRAPKSRKEQDKDLQISPFNAGLGTVSTITPTAFQNQQLGDRLEVS